MNGWECFARGWSARGAGSEFDIVWVGMAARLRLLYDRFKSALDRLSDSF